MVAARPFRHTTGGIDWHVEQRGAGPDIVLIPSGEGDCASFETTAADLARDFRVTTFDTPGFSRSTVDASVDVSMPVLAEQVAALVRSLGIECATFYGCSSGGLAALDLTAFHADIVKNVIVHEAALPTQEVIADPLKFLIGLDDATVSAACADLYAGLMNENLAAWQALGPDYHSRLSTNYVTWVRRYLGGPAHKPVDPATLAGKPIRWTIGGLGQVMHFFSNVQMAHAAGIELEMLMSKHFPQVSIPDQLAAHIRNAAQAAQAAYE